MEVTRRGFSRPDLAAIVVAMAFFGCGVLIPAMNAMRRETRGRMCEHNLLVLGNASTEHMNDSKDALPSLSWDAVSAAKSIYWEAKSGSELGDAQRRALERLRQITQCNDLEGRSNWLPQVRFNWLSLESPERPQLIVQTVCPEDTELLRLRVEHLPAALGLDKEVFGSHNVADRSLAAYRSTYEFVPASWCEDYVGAQKEERPTALVEQGATDSAYRVPSKNPFGHRPRRMFEVGYPSQKVYVYDPFDRHIAPTTIPFADPEACQRTLFFDGSVQLLATKQCNPGGQPNDALMSKATLFKFRWPREQWEGGFHQSDEFMGYYRWTRLGLAGRDYGGPEVGRFTSGAAPGSTTFIDATP